MRIVNQMKLEIMSIPENVALARVTVAAFASQIDYTLSDLDEIKVAVSEAISNAIIHGYSKDPNQIVSVVASIFNDQSLEIIIEDKGKGIENVEEAIQPAFTTDDERMGLGFVFMQSFMDELKVDSVVNQGTKIKMVKKFDQHAQIQNTKGSQ